jgi:integrase
MAKLPFSVFRRAGRRFYSVAFKNEATGEYLPAISTKQETETAAIETAFRWLRDGIPRQGEAVPVKKYTLRDMATETDITVADCEFICKELQRRGLLKSFVMAETRAAVSFTEYLLNFWDYDNSPYVREKLRKNHGIHRRYCNMQKRAVEVYWQPLFSGRVLGEISKKDIEALIDTLDAAGLSPQRKNYITKAGTIALKWAFNKEMIDRDVTQGITWFSGKCNERQILTPELTAGLFRVQWADRRARLACMLAALAGMRAGEIQGLRVQDIGRDCLYVRHSWNCIDGLKTTKTNEARTVELPFPGIIQELINLAKDNPHGAGLESFVFWADRVPGKPVEQCVLVRGLRAALENLGMSKKAAAGYCVHGLRHTYTAYLRDKINDKLLQSQTGHKTAAMLDHYSNHRKAGDRLAIQAVVLQAFGPLIKPEYAVATS